MQTTTTEVQRIDKQLEAGFRRQAWHGPAVQEALEDVGPATAAARPIRNAHSIWEIAVHIGVWKDVVTRRLGGDPVANLSDELDWPAVTDTSEAAWRRTLEQLETRHQELRRAVAGIRDEQLDEAPAKGTSTRYVLIHGVIQHDIYHAGQISLLKKA